MQHIKQTRVGLIVIILSLVCFVPAFAGSEVVRPLGERNPSTAQEAKKLQTDKAAELNVPVEKTVNIAENINIDLVFIPQGKFHMGSPRDIAKSENDERPLHQVNITKGFYMSKYEVTQKQYLAIMKYHKGLQFVGDQLPVDNIEWYEANTFIEKLSQQTKLKFRFPTEAEWEYACKAGTETPFYTGNTIGPDQANYDCESTYMGGPQGSPYGETRPVGSYPANPFGLYDMHGNVWEWCADWYDDNYYKFSPEDDPQGPHKGGKKVIRGGAWSQDPDKLRSADRRARDPKSDRENVGFRLALDL
ncbi:MAG TPA: formylglycine-generating enzyme family protein [Sedimentisphaerales bacterium]|nr:formylglycine-generating enzyme family protein [Sedimentisphaerales bacterium]